MRVFASLLSLTTAHLVNSHGECDSMLQVKNPSRSLLQEDCAKSPDGCKPTIIVGTTPPPTSNISECQGGDAVHHDAKDAKNPETTAGVWFEMVAEKKKCTNRKLLGDSESQQVCASLASLDAACGPYFERHQQSGLCFCLASAEDCEETDSIDPTGGNSHVNRYKIVKNCLAEICEEGTILDFTDSTLTVNNLGGMGPDYGQVNAKFGKVIKWTNVGKVKGRSIDLMVSTEGDDYYDDNINITSYVDRYGRTWPSGEEFVHQHNGARFGAGTIASMAPEGNWTFNFHFVYTDDQTDAVIPVLPLTFYDIDGGKETTSTCDASHAIVHRHSDLTGSCEGKCCVHQGILEEIVEPTDWDSWLTEDQLKASVTYVMKEKSSFTMHYSTVYSHRIFFFKGSKVLACEW